MFIDRFLSQFLACIMIPDFSEYSQCIDDLVIEFELKNELEIDPEKNI